MKAIAIILLIIITGFLVGINIQPSGADLVAYEFELNQEEYWKARMDAIEAIDWESIGTNYE